MGQLVKEFPNCRVKPKLLFKTDDGVQLFNKTDEVFATSRKKPGKVQRVSVTDIINNPHPEKWYHFSSREKLEKLIDHYTSPVEKSDQYKISIPELLLRNPGLDNVRELKSLLEDNGYYSRTRIKLFREQGKTTNNVKIDIYLPDSVYIYSFPQDTYYSLKEKKVLRVKNKIKTDPAIGDFMTKLLYVTGNENKEHDPVEWMKTHVRVRSDYNIVRATTIMNQVIHFGLIKDDKFVLKTEQDVTEVYENLFSTKYIL